MADKQVEFWDYMYKNTDSVYGKEPNAFFREQIVNFQPGKILFPAEGEGRNAVYASTLGWDVYAFDQSFEVKKKALRLAKDCGVTISYQLQQVHTSPYAEVSFDAIALIFAHFDEQNRRSYHQYLALLLKKGGLLVLEAFGKSHALKQQANPQVGGSKHINMLCYMNWTI